MPKYFKCKTNKNAVSYKCGEKIVFTVTAKDTYQNMPYGFLRWTLKGDDGKSSGGLYEFDNHRPLVLETTLDRPGFVRLTVSAKSKDCPDGSFDVLEAGAGAEIEKLEYCDTIPEDFDKYWGDIEKLVADHNPEVICHREITNNVPKGFKAYDVRVSVPCDSRPASGILTYPDDGGKYPLRTHFLGYSIANSSAMYNDNTMTFCINAHGLENDISKTEIEYKYGDELNNYGMSYDQNSSNMTTYWRNVMIRNLIAAKYAKSLPQWNGKGFTAFGGSQGALQATTLAAHDKDVTFLDINVPWFCNLNAENHGFMGGWRPKFAEGLRYFDTVAQSARVKCAVRIGARLGDYTCPPSTTFTLYNTFKTVKALDLTQAGTHGYYPPEAEIFKFRYDPENPTGELKLGKYRYFEGGEYEVLGFCKNSETGEESVINKSLETGETLVTPKYKFEEYIPVDGLPIKAFEYIG